MQFKHLHDHEPLPVLLEPESRDRNLLEFAQRERDAIKDAAREHGALLFRGFDIDSPKKFNEFCLALSGKLLNYTERSTPRSHVEGDVFTSTDYPPEGTIPLHCEMAYTRYWPRYIWFYAHLVATEGGETPICDARKVYRTISPATRERFEKKSGIMYVRNFRKGIDLSWQEVYGVNTKEELEAYCRAHDITFEWHSADVLRTRAVAQAVVRHPETGEMVWFNQAHLFHVSNLAPEVRKFLITKFKEDGVPRNAFYGDGTSLEPDVLAEIRDAYTNAEVAFPWLKGDVLMVDNMQISHGRRPFKGERKTLVAMAGPYRER